MRAGAGSPLGAVWVEVAGGAVVAAGWGPAPAARDPLAAQALAELAAYFRGELTAFTVPLRPAVRGLAAKVSRAMRAIPYGETRSYGEIARAVDAPPQAVGQACGANPIPILIPCHRVLAANGLGGFSAPGGVESKVALLRLEGAASLLL